MSIIPIALIALGLFWWIINVGMAPESRTYKPVIQTQNPPEEPLRVIIEDSLQVNRKWETPIHFERGDPTDWDEYHGQERIKEFVQLRIDSLEDDKGLKLMFIAPKGSGKTTLFRIIGSKLTKIWDCRYVEVTPAVLRTKNQVDDLLSWVKPHDVICVDEIHMFSRKVADVMLPAIEDGIHPFEDGMKPLPCPLHWIGATTDVGLLPPALQDRFQMLALSKLSKDNMINILRDQDFLISQVAAAAIATRALSSPRELKRIYDVAKSIAILWGDTEVLMRHATKAFDMLDLDANGLYPQDRQVLRALFEHPKKYASGALRHAHSERAIRAITGLDEALYRDQIEPRLLQQGFITIGTGGRELTEKAFESYFSEGG